MYELKKFINISLYFEYTIKYTHLFLIYPPIQDQPIFLKNQVAKLAKVLPIIPTPIQKPTPKDLVGEGYNSSTNTEDTVLQNAVKILISAELMVYKFPSKALPFFLLLLSIKKDKRHKMLQIAMNIIMAFFLGIFSIKQLIQTQEKSSPNAIIIPFIQVLFPMLSREYSVTQYMN
ncbi:hypothetical protein PPERSA_02354 [Pseudocohnilembus persalinus]|uniref:Uncharacterized protein n=1 Tax=Pseudocohnilembus persalinus TaxID=266149 RepID=A0A0V0QUD6_PSEPJ|nr:hypothetical protein PPERSA_02354 [Pseudocohnilembus persalinus]|eukprot:KRX05822.1 hypothetical protein PPERSA_02354 [Pseudocohnilembus persalinus]